MYNYTYVCGISVMHKTYSFLGTSARIYIKHSCMCRSKKIRTSKNNNLKLNSTINVY